jgi:hypothetical protein
MPTLNNNDLWVINFLNGKDFVSPTRIGSAYGYFIDKKNIHSSWASPICKKLESMGFLVANAERRYKLKTMPSNIPKPKAIGFFVDDSGKICTAYYNGTSDGEEATYGFCIRKVDCIYYEEEINIFGGEPYDEKGFPREVPIHDSYVLWASREELQKVISQPNTKSAR